MRKPEQLRFAPWGKHEKLDGPSMSNARCVHALQVTAPADAFEGAFQPQFAIVLAAKLASPQVLVIQFSLELALGARARVLRFPLLRGCLSTLLRCPYRCSLPSARFLLASAARHLVSDESRSTAMAMEVEPAGHGG